MALSRWAVSASASLAEAAVPVFRLVTGDESEEQETAERLVAGV
jgi:hypothetical protein